MQRLFVAVLTAIIAAHAGDRIFAQSPVTIWKAEIDATRDWFDPELWTAGVPMAGAHALLVNGSETMLIEGNANALSLTLGRADLGRSLLTQIGGQLEVEQLVTIDDGVYRMVGGRLEADALAIDPLVLDPGVTEVLNADLSNIPRPEPRFPMPPEIIPIDFEPIRLPADSLVFFLPEARFQLDGGESHFRNGVTVGRGQLVINGGKLDAGELFVDANGGWFNRNNAVSQNGGATTIRGQVKIQDGA